VAVSAATVPTEPHPLRQRRGRYYRRERSCRLLLFVVVRACLRQCVELYFLRLHTSSSCTLTSCLFDKLVSSNFLFFSFAFPFPFISKGTLFILKLK
jgi:hypothetical protein